MQNEFEKQLRANLIIGERAIDPAITRQLNAVRQQAIEGYRKPRFWQLRGGLWPATGMVTAALLVFMVVLSPLSPLPSHNTAAVNEQGIESMEMLEDLDFYYWLAENEAELRG